LDEHKVVSSFSTCWQLGDRDHVVGHINGLGGQPGGDLVDTVIGVAVRGDIELTVVDHRDARVVFIVIVPGINGDRGWVIGARLSIEHPTLVLFHGFGAVVPTAFHGVVAVTAGPKAGAVYGSDPTNVTLIEPKAQAGGDVNVA